MNDAFLQQVPHMICYVTTKETCPRTAVCLLPGPSPVCTACGPACAVYHGVGHTIDRPAAHFLQAGTFRHAAHPVPRRCARCVPVPASPPTHAHLVCPSSTVLYRRAWTPAPTGRRGQPFCREMWKEWAHRKNYRAERTSTSEVCDPQNHDCLLESCPGLPASSGV